LLFVLFCAQRAPCAWDCDALFAHVWPDDAAATLAASSAATTTTTMTTTVSTMFGDVTTLDGDESNE
jgi:hypothetical protein